MEFNRKDFGEKIKNYRRKKGLSQTNLADKLGKDTATISRYENGDLIPNLEDTLKVCEELGVYVTDLLEDENKSFNKEESKNPFKTDKLFVYFNAYDFRTKKFGKGKYILKFEERSDRIKVDMVDYQDGRIYSRGYMLADNSCAFISFENYKPTSARLDICEMIVNVCNGVDGLMLGAYFGTNASYEPSIRKCYFCKKDIEFTDEMLADLKPTEDEIQKLKETYALYLDIFNK